MKKSMKKIITGLLLLPIFIGLFGAAKEVHAETTAKTTDITINKRIWRDGQAPEQESIPNTGEIIDDFGGEPLAGAGFTVYDVTTAYLTLVETKGQAEAAKEITSDPATYATTMVKTEQKTDGNGQTTFTNLALKDGEKDKAYLIVETSTPNEVTVTEKSVPILLAMPIYKLATDGKFSDELNTNIQVYPKNETQTDKKEIVPSSTFAKLTDADGNVYYDVTTGDTLTFKLTLNIPADIAESGVTYSVTDTPSAGLAYISGSLTANGLILNTDYTLIENSDGGFTLTLNKTDSVLALAQKQLVATYNMKLTAEVNPDDLQDNQAQVTVSNTPQEKITPPEKLGTGGKKFIKTDAQNGNGLSGAEFAVTNSEGKFATFTQNSEGEYVFTEWTENQAESTTILSNTTGKFAVKGLVDGEYALVETKAPSDKYVVLKEKVPFIVTHGNYDGEENLQTVKNSPKGLLPSTGGTGIYAFLLIGGSLMLVAYIWLKKAKKQTEI